VKPGGYASKVSTVPGGKFTEGSKKPSPHVKMDCTEWDKDNKHNNEGPGHSGTISCQRSGPLGIFGDPQMIQIFSWHNLAPNPGYPGGSCS
jgi:hypothetical protein